MDFGRSVSEDPSYLGRFSTVSTSHSSQIESGSVSRSQSSTKIYGESDVVLKVAKGPRDMSVNHYYEDKDSPHFLDVPLDESDAVAAFVRGRPVSAEVTQVLNIPFACESIGVSESLSEQGSISLPESQPGSFSKPGATSLRYELVNAADGNFFPEQSFSATEETYMPGQSFSASGVFLSPETLDHFLDPLESGNLPPLLESANLPRTSFSASPELPLVPPEEFHAGVPSISASSEVPPVPPLVDLPPPPNGPPPPQSMARPPVPPLAQSPQSPPPSFLASRLKIPPPSRSSRSSPPTQLTLPSHISLPSEPATDLFSSSERASLDCLSPPSYSRPPPNGPPPKIPPSLRSSRSSTSTQLTLPSHISLPQSIARPDVSLSSESSRDLSPPTLRASLAYVPPQIPSAPELFAVPCR
jgi:hypothetical protein